ncbi:MAG: SusC/RagA family TonB-linked outer membrane protein [Bacteroidota bacterium]
MNNHLFLPKLLKRLRSAALCACLLTGLLPVSQVMAQQSFAVSGTVTSVLDGGALPGVNVVIKGTRTGVITNNNGEYSIEVSGTQAILVYSYIGYETRELTVGNQRIIDVALAESAEQLEEVVVTALGITREEKSLGFSVGKVAGEEINRVVNENVLNSLAGKVSGVVINSTGGTGSSVNMVIRGAGSLTTDNQPLFVVDGVPMINTVNNTTQFGERNIVDYGNAISDINPDDIESISVLKGASAAALYGSRAGNGVIMITTKSGNRASGMTVNVTSNTVFDRPYKYFETQKHFSSGYFSFTPENYPGSVMKISPAQAAGAGIECDKGYYALQWHSPKDALGNPVPIEVVSNPDNVANFVRTGITTTNGLSVANHTELMDYRIGYANMSHQGIVPNTDLFKNSLSLAGTVKATKKLTISSNFNINRSWSDNRPSSNRGTNPLEWAYKVPLNIPISELEDYWEPGQEGVQQRTPYNGVYDNPYFLAYEVNNSFTRDRVYGNLKALWQILPELSLMGRYSLDRYSEKRETKIGPSYSREPNNGAYGVVDLMNYDRNADFLLSYTRELSALSFTVSGGGNARYAKGSSLSNSSKSKAGLIVPGVYTVSNIKSGSLNYGSGWSQMAVYSLYGLANLSFKDMVYLDLTYRSDWASTLPKENWRYDYPSVSLSMLINEMVDLGRNVNLFKLRGGVADVGNGTHPYNLVATYGNVGQWGDATRLSVPGKVYNNAMKNEDAISWEFGTDLRMFNDRIRFEGTYFEADNRDQIYDVRFASSTGYPVKTINAGLIESKGLELLVGGTPVRNNNWTWDITANFYRDRTTLTEIAEGVELIRFWNDAKGGAWTYEGDQIGDIYDSRVITVEDPESPYYGYPIIGGSDNEWQDIKSEDTRNKIGNYNPDFLLGLQTSVTFKGFSLNMTFDWRKGGQFVSQTYRYMAENANSQHWLDQLIHPGNRTGKELRDWLVANEDEYIRNGFHVVGGPTPEYGGFPESWSGVTVNDGYFIPGVIEVPDGEGGVTYVEHLGENMGEPNGTTVMPYIVSYPWGFTAPSTFDSDFVKLREISLSYQLPISLVSRIGIKNASVSVFSRNIMLWTKAKIGIDPERAFQAEAGHFKQGIERYNVEPWVMPVGIKLNLTF